MPGLTDFMIFKIYNRVVDVNIYGGSHLKRAVCKIFMGYIEKCQHDMIDALKASGRFRAPGPLPTCSTWSRAIWGTAARWARAGCSPPRCWSSSTRAPTTSSAPSPSAACPTTSWARA